MIDLSTARWRKSSYSGPENDACVEVADNVPGTVPVRDSKDPGGPTLLFDGSAWSSFVHALKRDASTAR